MSTWDALILGIVEGLTEYLPVSSTGHIILAQRALGIESSEAADAFAICIQAGAILAVLAVYAREVVRMMRGLAGYDPEGRRLALQLIVAFLPAAIIGLIGARKIKEHLFGLWPITAAWFVGGIAILVVAHAPLFRRVLSGEGKRLTALTWGGALTIGLMQCLGMWPGTSRSLVTILGGVFAGLSLSAALEFSFLLGLLTLTAATAHDAYKHADALRGAYDVGTMSIGFVTAALAAAVTVYGMLRFLRRRGLALFGYYRIVLAIVVAALLSTHRLSP